MCPFCKPAEKDTFILSYSGDDVKCLICGATANIEAWKNRPIEDALRADRDRWQNGYNLCEADQLKRQETFLAEIARLRAENEALRKKVEELRGFIGTEGLMELAEIKAWGERMNDGRTI